MTWPTSNVDTANLDAGTDTVPRTEFMSWAQKFNQMREHVSAFWQGVLDKTTASDAQTAMGATATGKSVFTAADDAAVRTAAGATATGSSLMTAASNAAAFSAIKQAATESATGVVELATTTEAAAGTDTNRAVPPAGLEAHMNANALGWGQTWQDMLASRVEDTAYQNTTGRPIQVAVAADAQSNPRSFQVSINGSTWILVGRFAENAGLRENNVFAVIPTGWYYKVVGPATITHWAELR